MKDFVITIARGYGSGGRGIAAKLSERLGIDYYDRDIVKISSEESGINMMLFGQIDEQVKKSMFGRATKVYKHELYGPQSSDFISDENLFNYQANVIKELANAGPCIIVGRCADYILRGRTDLVRIFIYASHEHCTKVMQKRFGLNYQDASNLVEKTDRHRATYYKYHTDRNWKDVSNYDLCINTTNLDDQQAVDIILNYLETR